MAKKEEGKTINLSKFPRYDYNPSSIKHGIIGLQVGGNIKTTDSEVLGDGGEVLDRYKKNAFKFVVNDTKKFVKLYEHSYRDLVKLSSSGVAVFVYILINLREQQDWMTIRNDVFGEWYKTLEGCADSNTKMICYRGVIDLLINKFIFIKTGDNSFYININKYFNGKVGRIGWVGKIEEEMNNFKEPEKVKNKFNKELAWIKDFAPSSEDIEKM